MVFFRWMLLILFISPVLSIADDTKDRLQKMEQRLSQLEKKMADSEKLNTVCINERTAAKDALKEKEQDIKDCSAHLSFKGTYEERNLGFSVIEIMKGGCVGTIKMHTEKFRGEGQVEKTESNFDGPVETKMQGRMGPGLAIEKIEKKVVDPSNPMRSSPYERELDLKLRDYESREFSSVVLGKMYAVEQNRSGGTLGKGVYKYKYNVTLSSKDELLVNMETERAEQWTHMPIGEKSTAKLTLTCKTLKQLNELSNKQPEDQINTDISRKVFGQ